MAMFLNGTALIRLGAPTKTECLENRMRLEDALWALSASKSGVVLGGGVSFLQLAKELDLSSDANKIWAKSLKKPFEQVLVNAGLDSFLIQNQMEKMEYKTIYNVSNNIWEDTINTEVIDPYLVIKHTLINATSIAVMLLTTTSLIINENVNKKEEEYNNW